jgi:hypothetical protein
MKSLKRYTGLLLAVLLLGGCDFGSGGSGDQADIRLLNVSPGYDSLDLYTNNNDDDDDSDSKKIEAVSYNTVSSYAEVDSDTYTIKFKRNGVTSTLATLSSEKLTDDTHGTYVAYGSTGHFAALKIAEDVSEPDSNLTKLSVLNTAEAGSLDVYLTDSSASLEDASPQFGTVAAGSAAAMTTIDSGTYRLRVTGAGDTSDLRLDVPEVTFSSKQVASLILTATSGGVLVNALVLPQEGKLTTYSNTKARVRGAVGVASGTVTAKVGGVSILSSQTVGVINSKYSQVDSGSAAVILSVDGAQVSVPNQTLEAGGDYTLLVWSNADGTQTTLVTDDNRYPSSSGQSKVRLLNGASGLGTAITLSIDYSPIVEGIELGTASDFVEIDSGTDFQVDVSETNTATPLKSTSGVTLQDSGVYTMFVAGGGGTDVTATLRKNR